MKLTTKDARIITGWTFLFLFSAVVYAGGWWLTGFFLLIIIFGSRELLALLKTKDLEPNIFTAYFGCTLFAFLGGTGKIEYVSHTMILLSILSFMSILLRGKNARIKDIGATLLTVVYGGLLPSHLLFMRNMNAGTVDICGYNISLALWFLVITVCCITVTDVAAYFAGYKFGKHKLWTEISPKKTIEGSVAGTIASISLALILGNDVGLQLWQSLSLGILITLFAQLGDLVESMMKRDAGAKDASDILPGHGGLLDRADSYIFTVPVAYYFMYYFIVNPIF